MKQIKEKILLLSSIILIAGCAESTTNLTTALKDGVSAGVKTSMDNNKSTTTKTAVIDGTQVGLKSALGENQNTKDKNASESMTTKVIDGVADHLKEK